MTDANSMVRIGIVSSVDSDWQQARVYFPDQDNMVSGWLFVLQQPMTGTTGTTDSHHHSISGTTWMPQINQKVLCLMMCGSETDGYILGVIP